MTVLLLLHRDSALAATAAMITTLECTLTLALVTSLEVQSPDLGFAQQERQMVTLVARMTIAGADNPLIGILGLVNCFARAIGTSIKPNRLRDPPKTRRGHHDNHKPDTRRN